MVKTGGTKSATANTTKGKENPAVFILMRDIVTGVHHVIPRGQAVTSKKVQKLAPGDEIGFGERGARIRGVILLLGTEGQCKTSLITITKAKGSTNKMKKNKEENVAEDKCKIDDVNEVEEEENSDTNESEDLESSDGEDDNLEDENDAPRVDEDESSKDVVRSTSSNEGTESSGGVQKRKLSFDDSDEEPPKHGRVSYGKTVPISVHVMLERKAKALEAQVLEFKTSWMPRPSDRNTTEYFIDIGRILSGKMEIDPDEKSEILLQVIKTLKMTEKELEDCKGKNISITVRQIMKQKYCNKPVGFKFAEVDQNHIAAARDYARLMHSTEEKMYTDGDLNHSMGNVFASKTHRNNFKPRHHE